eukprot:SAG11_NODE_34_length_22265_cov_11.264730_9_plen_182_part_00
MTTVVVVNDQRAGTAPALGTADGQLSRRLRAQAESHVTTSQASRVFASHDDMDRDETLHLIEHNVIREDALGFNIEDRLQKSSRNSGGVFMRANPRRREETAWLETLTISQINDKIAERKAWVSQPLHLACASYGNPSSARAIYIRLRSLIFLSQIPFDELGIVVPTNCAQRFCRAIGLHG